MKLLLHICCAPCLIWPYEVLKERNFSITGLFYNPNIHPYLEYQRRKEAIINYSKEINFEVVFLDYEIKDFFRETYLKEEGPLRCKVCWNLRLKKTAEFARSRNFDYFSTTLLVSPYQDHLSLIAIGKELEKEYQIKFYAEDFRNGFKKAHQLAKEKGIYCQSYCGCVYSQVERFEDG
ncbi:MAG: epoxyqueuosine reductase QueH [Candidatus Omnitrophica bacterium]|nr:epoxyqueuosine reductase QueH [Candidatus Omnitrophota bacterium]